MDGLLATCKTCEKNGLQIHAQEKCAGCQVYTELREIGDQLGRKKPVAKLEMTVDEFIKLKHENKLPMAKIAELKGCSEANIYYWQNTRKSQIDKALGKVKLLPQTAPKIVTDDKKPHPCNCTKDDKSAEYERLIKALRDDLNKYHDQLEEKDEMIRNLQSVVEKYEQVNAACEDVENETAELQNEVSRLREERNQFQEEAGKLLEKNVQTDYQLENWKNRYKTLMEQNAHMEKENRAFREALKLCL
jgi:DNA repair exonuclease SbcCD ATPase subunit